MGGMFKGPKAPAVKPVEPLPEPTPIPDKDDKSIKQAERRKIAEQRLRSGVQSTMLGYGGRSSGKMGG